MGNDLSSSSNELLKKLSSTVMNDSWLKNMYGVNKTDQQNELKKIFTVISSNDVTESERKVLLTRKEVLQDKVERLEAKMAVLEEELAKNQAEIARHADEITNLITSVEDKSEALEEQQKRNVKNAIEDVFYEYEKGIIGKDAVSGEIRKRVKNNSYKDRQSAAIEKLLGKLDAKEAEVDALVNDATKWIDQRNLLKSQYGVTKSTYDLINGNLAKIGNTETNYTNSDYDKLIPVYSLEKTDIVSDLFEDPKINVESGKNSNYVEGTKIPSVENINEKFGKYFGTKATSGVDSNSIKNEAVKNLGEAINNGLLEELNSAGIYGKELTDFFVKNFSGANIKYSDKGTLNVPIGHGSDAQKIFGKLTDFIENNKLGNDTSKWTKENFKGTLNTWDEMGGNTIDSNKQIAALADNYAAILDKMGSGEPKFTFKEAMYALFNPDSGLFKNSGVVYDPELQGETPNYFIEYAGDDATAEMYKNLATKIYDIWGVKPSRGADVENYDEDSVKDPDDGGKTPEIDKKDPITFKLDDGSEYAFIIDRNNDGAFSGSEDFVGGLKGTSWLDDLKSLDANSDGKLSGDELQSLKILGTDYTDNYKTKYTGGKFLNEQTTNIQYKLTNADAMGIGEINLEGLEEQVDKSKNINDINGSELFNDSFKFALNGQEITATRKDDTDYFMNAIYKDAYGKNFNIGMSENEVQSIMDKDYGEFDKFDAAYADVYTDVSILASAGQAAQETRAMYNETMDRVNQDENAQLLRASNKAAALTNISDWTNVQAQVAQIAINEGIVIDMEQAKGIYVTDGSLSAQGVVDKYKEMIANENSIANEKAIQKEAWDAIVLCVQNGVAPSADKILEMLSSGEAKTAQEVVDILKQAQDEANITVNVNDLGFDSEREEEIYNAFNEAFNAVGLNDKVVDALAELCVEQQNDRSFMQNKSAQDLAQLMLKRYQAEDNTQE